MDRLPCVGVLLRPQKPRQDAKKSRGSRPVFLLSHLPSKVRNENSGMSKTITGVMPIRTVGLTPGHRWCGELRSVKPAVNNGKGARGLVQGPNSLNASYTHPGRISGRPRKLASDLRNRHLGACPRIRV